MSKTCSKYKSIFDGMGMLFVSDGSEFNNDVRNITHNHSTKDDLTEIWQKVGERLVDSIKIYVKDNPELKDKVKELVYYKYIDEFNNLTKNESNPLTIKAFYKGWAKNTTLKIVRIGNRYAFIGDAVDNDSDSYHLTERDIEPHKVSYVQIDRNDKAKVNG
jgi:hypothetical protein